MDKRRLSASLLIAAGMSLLAGGMFAMAKHTDFSAQPKAVQQMMTTLPEGGAEEAAGVDAIGFEEEAEDALVQSVPETVAGSRNPVQTKPQADSAQAEQEKAVAVPEQSEEAVAEASAEMISIPGLEQWSIPAGKTQVEAAFYNPEQNSCFFVLTISLAETGEVLYQSKELKPGAQLDQVALKKAMKAGSYAALLQYDTYALADHTPLNGASVPFTLVVTDEMETQKQLL